MRVWDPATGRDCFSPLQHPVPCTWAEFSPDGSRLVTCGADQGFTRCEAQIWSAATGKPLGAPLQHDDGVLSACFSPDGRRVSTASEDFTAAVWDARTGKRITPALKHDDQVWGTAFSADGKWVATASSDRSARVWSAETGDPLTPPLLHRVPLVDVRFLPDGGHLVTSNGKGTFWKWELPSDPRPVEYLRKLARLLSANAVALAGEPGPPRSESLETLWRSLREQYPAGFAASAHEISRWHECEAEHSEHDKQWFAAAFHLRQLLALQPGDSSLNERLMRAEAHLKTGMN